MKRILLIFICIIVLLSGCGWNMFTQDSKATSAKTLIASSEQVLSSNVFSVASGLSAPSALYKTEIVSEPQKVKISAVGDLMCLYGQLSAARKNGVYGFDYCFSEVKSRITGADIAIGNLETLIAQGYPYTKHNEKGYPKINGPEEFLSAASACGFDVLVNANNHIFDWKYDGIDKTLKKMDEYGFKHTGAYAQGQNRDQLVLDVKGIKIAVLAYTGGVNGHPKNVKGVNIYSESLVKSDIEEAKSAGAEYIIVYVHWGKEMTHSVAKVQKKVAAFIANAGADLILGSHPHCTQSAAIIETDHGSVPVFYSLGNFVSSMGSTICRDSIIVNITIEKDAETNKTELASLTYTPTHYTSFLGRNWVVIPADLSYIEKSGIAKILLASRARTIKVLGTEVAKPE